MLLRSRHTLFRVYYDLYPAQIGERKTVSSKVLVIIEDDLDGTKADETVEFGLDGAAYAIDLSDDNAKKLRGVLDGYVRKARKVSGRRSSSRKTSSGIDNRTVRRWAEANGIELSKRGRIPQDVVSQFRAAGN
jgi:hypothetical protein